MWLCSDFVLQHWTALAGLSCLLLFSILGLIDALRDLHSWKGDSKPKEGTKSSRPHRVQQLSSFLVVN